MSRLEALRAALAELPPVGTETGQVVIPERSDDGAIGFPYVLYDQALPRFFHSFNAGAFGFAAEDRDYGEALERWREANRADPIDATNVALLDREACLLVLRKVDRAERFCEGAWASAHGSGLLHAMLDRLIVLELG